MGGSQGAQRSGHSAIKERESRPSKGASTRRCHRAERASREGTFARFAKGVALLGEAEKRVGAQGSRHNGSAIKAPTCSSRVASFEGSPPPPSFAPPATCHTDAHVHALARKESEPQRQRHTTVGARGMWVLGSGPFSHAGQHDALLRNRARARGDTQAARTCDAKISLSRSSRAERLSPCLPPLLPSFPDEGPGLR